MSRRQYVDHTRPKPRPEVIPLSEKSAGIAIHGKHYPTSKIQHNQPSPKKNKPNGKVKRKCSRFSKNSPEVINITKVTAKPREPKYYVLDTNIIIDCVDILYDKDDELWRAPIDLNPDLSNADLIIPEQVFLELEHLRDEDSMRGLAAKVACLRLKKLMMNSGRSIDEVMSLNHSVKTGWNTQTITILPLSKGLLKFLPHIPYGNDYDGMIIVTTIAAKLLANNLPFSEEGVKMLHSAKVQVPLVTNDNPMATKADLYNVCIRSLSFTKRITDVGSRRLVVPGAMFYKFYCDGSLSEEDFVSFMPTQLPLIDNEYIFMSLSGNDKYPSGYCENDGMFKNIARYCKKDHCLYGMENFIHAYLPSPNADIAAYNDALADEKISVILVRGAAGTGKTYTAVNTAISAIKHGDYSRIVYISAIKAKNDLGALPGDTDDKLEPLVSSVRDAIRSFIEQTKEFEAFANIRRRYGASSATKNTAAKSYSGASKRVPQDRKTHRKTKRQAEKEQTCFYPNKQELAESIAKQDSAEPIPKTYAEMLENRVDSAFEKYFKGNCYPFEQVSGRTFNDAFIIIDEFERADMAALLTMITRAGHNVKFVLIGDENQIYGSDKRYEIHNGIFKAFETFMDTEIFASLILTKTMRSEIAEIATTKKSENHMRAMRYLGIL